MSDQDAHMMMEPVAQPPPVHHDEAAPTATFTDDFTVPPPVPTQLEEAVQHEHHIQHQQHHHVADPMEVEPVVVAPPPPPVEQQLFEPPPPFVAEEPATPQEAVIQPDDGAAVVVVAAAAPEQPPAVVAAPPPLELAPPVVDPTAAPTATATDEVDYLMSPNAAPMDAPKPRDVVFGQGSQHQPANGLLEDLIGLHKVVWKAMGRPIPNDQASVEVLAERLYQLMKHGKGRFLAGLKEVPKPFLVGSGRFMQRAVGTAEWKELSEEDAKGLLKTTILDSFRGEFDEEPQASSTTEEWTAMEQEFQAFCKSKPTAPVEFATAPSDILLLQINDADEDRACGPNSNKELLKLASHYVTIGGGSGGGTTCGTLESKRRVEASIKVILAKDDGTLEAPARANDPLAAASPPANKLVQLQHPPRFVLRKAQQQEGLPPALAIMNPVDAAEVILVFVFEVYLEKEAAGKQQAVVSAATGGMATGSAADAGGGGSEDIVEPSAEPIDDIQDADVLFGRGGRTNSHPGNRRFRDLIALHRPDYIRAVKINKPNVARKIVRAIRHGSPPGRFLKRADDGKWYDVGDRSAAEKTSQGLRERTNDEKRQRAAIREATRGTRGEEDDEDDTPPTKKAKRDSTKNALPLITSMTFVGSPLNYMAGAVGSAPAPTVVVNPPPRPPTSKEKRRSGSVILQTEGLPPNAVDKDGNILVTDYDILLGRGGLTNNHVGNKRFRDVVALHRADYIRAPKVQKPSVARVIVRAIRNGDPPGRFLKKNEKTGQWYDVGDKKAAEKTSQALREKAPSDRDQPSSVTGGAPYLFGASYSDAAATASAAAVAAASTAVAHPDPELVEGDAVSVPPLQLPTDTAVPAPVDPVMLGAAVMTAAPTSTEAPAPALAEAPAPAPVVAATIMTDNPVPNPAADAVAAAAAAAAAAAVPVADAPTQAPEGETQEV